MGVVFQTGVGFSSKGLSKINKLAKNGIQRNKRVVDSVLLSKGPFWKSK